MNPSLFGELLQTIGERGRALARPRLATGTKFAVLGVERRYGMAECCMCETISASHVNRIGLSR